MNYSIDLIEILLICPTDVLFLTRSQPRLTLHMYFHVVLISSPASLCLP